MKPTLLQKRDEVIENVAELALAGDLNGKVEVDDPKISLDQERTLVDGFVDQYLSRSYCMKRKIARVIANFATWSVNRKTTIDGLEKIADIHTGAIVTSNHFSPVDNTVVRYTVRKLGKSRLPVIGQAANLAMPALFGFLMRYADVIPICSDPHYMKRHFEPMLDDLLKQGEFVLIYPEQEMWFNYRKPRPCKRGAYQFAALSNVPVISCFVEIRDTSRTESPDFVEVSYAMHVLDPIYPDPSLTPRENSYWMSEKDYAQKCAAYEKAYGKKLDYTFSADDVAGWQPPDDVREKFSALSSTPVAQAKTGSIMAHSI